MCGINGIYSFSGQAVSDLQLVAGMNAAVRHRGPDDTGTWQNDSGVLQFGHCRLSIIDLSPGGHQPMTSAGGHTLVFNGEIYNYKELKEQLHGYPFRTESDTEVLLALYERKGIECLRDLKGMFAFALWDKDAQQLFLARDPVGKKPLYYTERDGRFAFSSEIRSLLTLPWVERKLDEQALYHFLTFNMLPPPLTMFHNISKFHPGYRMTVNRKGIQQYESYWEPTFADLQDIAPETAEQRTFDLIEKAVESRMVSDVPVGAFLSGGVDSSAIVALMSRLSKQPVKTYSIGFENQPAYDELKHAREVSKLFGTEHYEKIVTEQEIVDGVRQMAGIFDEPLADSTCIPIYFLSEKAREQGSKVVLTGDGSDEIFAGYRSYARYLRHYPRFHAWSRMPQWVRTGASTLASSIRPQSPTTEMLHRARHGQEFFWGGAKSFKESVKRNMLSSGFNRRSAGWDSYDVIREYRSRFEKVSGRQDDMEWMCYLGFRFVDTNLFLYRADKMGMAHSIELRSPFLDTNLVNFALSLPARYKLREGEPKYILKKSLERILPAHILYRKKMGFCVPLKEWAGGMMTDYVDAHLREFCEETGLFNEQALRNLAHTLRTGGDNATNDLWTIYFLMAWFEKWMP